MFLQKPEQAPAVESQEMSPTNVSVLTAAHVLLPQGRGVLLLSDFESSTFLRQLRDVDVKPAPPVPAPAASAIAPAVAQALQVLASGATACLQCRCCNC